MEPRHFCCALLLLLLGFRRAGAQDNTNYTVPAQFACNVSSPSCDTYVVYRTQSPGFQDLGSISDLFGTSQARIASANSLSSEDGVLQPGQPLVIPPQEKKGRQPEPVQVGTTPSIRILSG